ncbi:NAD(P)-binding protein [Dendrothele bispora CBS 962.96]|uniref:NAD(P)-binding protein n=1 Tax=Dendrothele bispora (strain CBS 962.96) TaxID=1314807 RepID=A0A4S8M4U6_DENBC|nr:NAD(P)-binding protein [Dendrothele bispora CBS 962.96]
MVTVANPRLVFTKRPPPGPPVAGEHLVLDTSRTIDIDDVPLNGGFLTKTLVLSPEPHMRDRMRDPSIPSYSTTYTIGAPIVAFAVVVVIRSEKEGVKPGDYMYGQTPWEAYTVQPYVEGRCNFKPEEWAPGTYNFDALVLQAIPDPQGAFPITRYTSILGTPGLTAYVAFEGIIGEIKPGETIFVSSGASAVGSLVIQIAKLKGMKVIASAGSDAKVAYMKSVGADVAFNYKKTSYDAALAEHGPIQVYWDNVGVEALDAALEAATAQAKFVICGSVGTDNTPPDQRYRLKNAFLIMKKRLLLRGFIVPDFLSQFGAKFYNEVPALVAQGKLKSEERIIEGWDNAAEALVDMMKTGHDAIGKPVVVVGKA